MKPRVMFPDIEDREEWHEAEMRAALNQVKPTLEGLNPIPEPVLDTPSDLAIGFVPHRGENRAMRRKAVATFQEPVAGLRRKLWAQRERNRLGKLDVETRRLQRKAK